MISRWRAVAGGSSRAESVRCGLTAVPAACDIVLVHDAARPLASRASLQIVSIWLLIDDAVDDRGMMILLAVIAVDANPLILSRRPGVRSGDCVEAVQVIPHEVAKLLLLR